MTLFAHYLVVSQDVTHSLLLSASLSTYIEEKQNYLFKAVGNTCTWSFSDTYGS